MATPFDIAREFIGAKPVTNPKPIAKPAPAAVPQSARAIVNSFLALYGLQSLGAWAWNQYTTLGGGQGALDQIKLELPDRPEYQQRFPAYKQMAAEGHAMTTDQMIAYEKGAIDVFHNAGIPQGFYDTPAELGQFMAGHVGITELKSRVDLAASAALSTPDVARTMSTYFGVPNAAGALTAYYLDPTKALPVIQQQFTAAQIGADATRTGNTAINAGQAMHLAQLGVTDAQAVTGFAHLGQQQGLFEQQVTGEAPIDQQTQLAAEFDNSAAAQLRIKQRQQARLADFQGASGENLTSKGLSGLGRIDQSV